MGGCHSLGAVYRKVEPVPYRGCTDRGKDFPNYVKEAEEHGLELTKEWVDRRHSEV